LEKPVKTACDWAYGKYLNTVISLFLGILPGVSDAQSKEPQSESAQEREISYINYPGKLSVVKEICLSVVKPERSEICDQNIKVFLLPSDLFDTVSSILDQGPAFGRLLSDCDRIFLKEKREIKKCREVESIVGESPAIIMKHRPEYVSDTVFVTTALHEYGHHLIYHHLDALKPESIPTSCHVDAVLTADETITELKTDDGPWGRLYAKYPNVTAELLHEVCETGEDEIFARSTVVRWAQKEIPNLEFEDYLCLIQDERLFEEASKLFASIGEILDEKEDCITLIAPCIHSLEKVAWNLV